MLPRRRDTRTPEEKRQDHLKEVKHDKELLEELIDKEELSKEKLIAIGKILEDYGIFYKAELFSFFERPKAWRPETQELINQLSTELSRRFIVDRQYETHASVEVEADSCYEAEKRALVDKEDIINNLEPSGYIVKELIEGVWTVVLQGGR